MAIDYSAEIDAIDEAIASGTTHVSYNGKSVEYDTFANLLARRAWLVQQANPNGPRRPTAAFASFSRGDC